MEGVFGGSQMIRGRIASLGAPQSALSGVETELHHKGEVDADGDEGREACLRQRQREEPREAFRAPCVARRDGRAVQEQGAKAERRAP